MTNAPFNAAAKVFIEGNGFDRIGRIYRKSVYRKYTPNWVALIPRGANEKHLGILGPIIRAGVGDTIVVHFKNNTPFPTSVHPHGVFYDKDSEGAPYADGTSGADKADDSVAPGGTHTYTWKVPKRAGPGKADDNSVLWLYHGHTDETADTNAGLIGPILISDKYDEKRNGRPKDVDIEFITLFTVFDENASVYIDSNISDFAPGANPSDGDFIESNLMHGINGLLWGNLAGLDMKKGKKVRWYVVGMGTEVDIHTPHWHGNTLLEYNHRVDTTDVFPATVKVLNMKPDNKGQWMYHCHVNDHLDAGMQTKYNVQ
jgi:FtsP/CotA-like multicopper oxidase with cupredoxin domain